LKFFLKLCRGKRQQDVSKTIQKLTATAKTEVSSGNKYVSLDGIILFGKINGMLPVKKLPGT
jgi:hypothetical protein